MSSTKNQYIVTAYIKDKRGKILSIGKNSYTKTHPRMVKLGKKVGYLNQEKSNIHAEVDAINKCRLLDKMYVIEIYVYSERSNTYRKSKPCDVCETAIRLAKIPFVNYQNAKGERVTVRYN